MNKKSILYIFVVLMALSLTLGAVSAEDTVAAVDEAPAVEGQAAGGDDVILTENAAGGEPDVMDVDFADVAVDVAIMKETPEEIVWGYAATNYGPDVAYDTLVRIDGSDNLYPYDYYATVGELYVDEDYALMWYVGDMLPGDVALLFLYTFKMYEGPYYTDALIESATFDPDLSNNYDIEWADAEPAEASAAEETMPAAGNPIAMALLALITIAGATISRRF